MPSDGDKSFLNWIVSQQGECRHTHVQYKEIDGKQTLCCSKCGKCVIGVVQSIKVVDEYEV